MKINAPAEEETKHIDEALDQERLAAVALQHDDAPPGEIVLTPETPRSGSSVRQIEKLEAIKTELESTVESLESQLRMERARCDEAVAERVKAQQDRDEMAARIAGFDSIEEAAKGFRVSASRLLPDIRLNEDLDRNKEPSGVRWGHLFVKEERAADGTVVTPGVFAFRRQIDFVNDSSYSKGIIEGRAKSTIDLMLGALFIGPVDSRTGVASFAQFPPLHTVGEDGKNVRVPRTLDVIVVVK